MVTICQSFQKVVSNAYPLSCCTHSTAAEETASATVFMLGQEGKPLTPASADTSLQSQDEGEEPNVELEDPDQSYQS